eukprot:COSAG01_NODE_44903_length_414_cov_1.247619_1_plen_71_part_10
MAHNLHTEMSQRKIRDFFCPEPNAQCVICMEQCVTDVEDQILNVNVYPINMHAERAGTTSGHGPRDLGAHL